MKAILKNQTGIEDWIKEKADYRLRRTEEKFVWPYDLGRLENFKQVIGFSCQPRSDGISWPVVEGCDQYTLTREQLKQKEDKRERTREYQVKFCPGNNTGLLMISLPSSDSPELQWSLVSVVSSKSKIICHTFCVSHLPYHITKHT